MADSTRRGRKCRDELRSTTSRAQIAATAGYGTSMRMRVRLLAWAVEVHIFFFVWSVLYGDVISIVGRSICTARARSCSRAGLSHAPSTGCNLC